LPRDIVTHATPCACPACGGVLRPFGEDVTEILDYVPGSFRVVRHVRPKLSCRACETIAQAPAPSLPIRRGRAGPGLLAHVLVAKYCDHLPLHRQAEIYAREDIDLSRSTLADMVGQVAALVRPLVDALAKHVMAGERVHADDTIVPVLEPGLGRARKARLWTYVRDDRPFGCADPPAVLYRYAPDRQGEHPQDHLRTFKGILQADAYAGYDELYRSGHVIEAACMAHARRKFWDVHEKTKSTLSREALEKIASLYKIEDAIRGQAPERRLAVRVEYTSPLMADLRGWLETTLRRISGRSDMAKAIRYSLNQWDALTLILRDGRACIDNSAAERAMRPVALEQSQLDLCRLRRRRCASRGRLQPDRHRQDAWARSRSLPAPRHPPHRRSPRQPGRRLAALEARRYPHQTGSAQTRVIRHAMQVPASDAYRCVDGATLTDPKRESRMNLARHSSRP
jgi:transposase